MTGIASAALLLLSATPAQGWCNLPTHTPWMRPGNRTQHGRAVPSSSLFPIVADVPRAVRSLHDRPVRLLGTAEAAKLGGTKVRTALQKHRRLRPYLIRAVYSTRKPNITVRWQGDHLYVSSDGLGCFAFTNRPVIVLLGKAPKELFVQAHATL